MREKLISEKVKRRKDDRKWQQERYVSTRRLNDLERQLSEAQAEHTAAVKRNALANERHQKQMKIMQDYFQKKKLNDEERKVVNDFEGLPKDEVSGRMTPEAPRLSSDVVERMMKEMHENQERMRHDMERQMKAQRDQILELLGTEKGGVKHDHSLKDQCAGTSQNFINESSKPTEPPQRNSNRQHQDSLSDKLMRNYEPPQPNLSSFDKLAMTLSRQQIQKLPEFSGDEAEWPFFESVFLSTTKEGNYSKEQNVNRLKRALKGDAREIVKDQLMFSSDATAIMEDLRAIFGSPERVMVSLLDKLFKMKPLIDQPTYKLGEFAVKVKFFVANAKAMQMEAQLCNRHALAKLEEKLRPEGFLDWMKIKAKKQSPTLDDFATFLMDRVKLLGPLAMKPPVTTDESNGQPAKRHGRLNAHYDDEKGSYDKCLVCQKRHGTARCFKLRDASPKSRRDLVRKFRICVCCLNSNEHGWRDCTERKSCERKGCEKFHHEWMHNEPSRAVNSHSNRADNGHPKGKRETTRRQGTAARPKAERTARTEERDETNDEQIEVEINNSHRRPNPISNSVLFKVVPITLYGNNDTSVSTYAFLDGGSSVTLLEKELYEKLELEGERKKLVLQWTKGITRAEDSYETTILLSGGGKNRKLHKLRNVNTVENLELPKQTVNVRELKERHSHLRDLPLDNMVNAKPQLLIGIQHSRLLISLKCRTGNEDDDPVAIKTELGWLVFGKTAPSMNLVALSQSVPPSYQFHLTEPDVKEDELHELVKKYFATEEFGIAPHGTKSTALSTLEEQRSDEIMHRTLRMVGNRMEIGLPWKTDDVELPDSYSMALNRLKSQEKSLLRKPELLEWTNQHIEEMVEKGHARVATPEELAKSWKRVAYIPTFTVVNKNKMPPKPRFVMDFAARTGAGKKGKSVNSELLKGPDMLAPLLGALCKFRENRVAVNADVKEMFHQVLIKEEDQHCQRFLWRNGDVTLEPTVYIMQVMAFGPTCSPWAAQVVKNTNAEKFRFECPEAVNSIVTHTYVDDYFNSHESIEEAVRVSRDAIKIFDNISFPLVGFQSNVPEFLAQLPPENVKQTMVSTDIDSSHDLLAKVLGMYWEPENDVFTYKLLTNNMIPKMLEKDYHPTKREILSTIMKVFDPLGLISHYMVRSKILLQEVWRDGTDWDEKINDRLLRPWLEWLTELKNIENLKIPRQYAHLNPTSAEVHLIVFADASETSFAATAYFRFEVEGNVSLAHVMSKTKVAPLKQLSIPKLELQAAVLAVRVAQAVKKLHTFTIHSVSYATDSKIVLSWITAETLKLRQFVAPRIGEILEFSTRNEWHHVRSKLNVADDGTKWKDPTMGDVNTRWFQGPDYLRLRQEEWPFQSALNLDFTEDFRPQLAHRAPELSFATLDEIKPKFKSTWSRYVRVIARLLRPKNLCKDEKLSLYLISPQELEQAECVLFRKIQLDAFPGDVHSLMNGLQVKDSSVLHNFTPFMRDGVIRMSSRAQRATNSYAARNPAILPNKHELVDLMIQHFHEDNFHVGEDSTVADVRTRAWVINARPAVQRIKRNCQHCKIKSAKPRMPIMGQLPPARMSFDTRPFTHVGVDCFGPYEVKYGRGKIKRWGIIFTCLTFRAVHLEILNDMTKEECLSSIRRLQARRGRSLHFYSDRGTNFVGADNVLLKDRAEMKIALGEGIAQKFGIAWHFQPAYSPWFGGAWERLIQAIKKTLDHILTGDPPREDILRNALIEAEIRINSRPLTHLPVDHEDEMPLTPNTALHGEDNTGALAPGVFSENDAYSRSSYRRSQALADRFHSRWLKEYLPTITRRSKWHKEVKNIAVNDIAILIDPNEPRDSWKKCRITKVYNGIDGQVRAADVILADGTVKSSRSAGRLAVLDVKGCSPESLTAEHGVEDVDKATNCIN